MKICEFPFVNSEYNNLKNLFIVYSEYNHNKIPPLLFLRKNISLLALFSNVRFCKFVFQDTIMLIREVQTGPQLNDLNWSIELSLLTE